MVANRAFQAELTPELSVLRVDPYDNQYGEVERIGEQLPFTLRQIDSDARLVSAETL